MLVLPALTNNESFAMHPVESVTMIEYIPGFETIIEVSPDEIIEPL